MNSVSDVLVLDALQFT